MSRIEQIINEFEDYIEDCKMSPLSKTNISANKEDLLNYILELRLRIPEEIKKYQKIIGQQDAILQDARNQAKNMIEDATQQTNELVSEHEITMLAQDKSEEIIREAREKAEEIVNNALNDANQIRKGAAEYTDSLLSDFQGMIEGFVQENTTSFDKLMDSLHGIYNTCGQNRSDLEAAFHFKNEEAAEEAPCITGDRKQS